MNERRANWYKSSLVILMSALLFFAVTMPFRKFFQVMAVTEVRPASAFNPLLGLMFGPAGALGCAIGNLVADVISGYSPLMLVLGFLVQMIYGLVPWYIWKRFGWTVRLNTSANILRYISIMLGDSLLTALLLGASMEVTGIGSTLSMTTLMLFLNNFVFCMVLGIPLLLAFTGRKIRKAGGNFSLNERFILIFLCLAIVSAAMIGFIAYSGLASNSQDLLDLWNRVYIYIAIDLFVFCVIIVCFVQYAERNITIPMEKMADIARDYIQTEKNGKLDTRRIVSACDQYVTVHGEAGDLAEAFRDLAVNLENYIENLTKITAEKERISAELNVATQIQADMLPNIFPAFPERSEFSVYASMNPAKEVGGDFYDFFLIDDTHLALVIADVSGKGVPAALFMVISKTLLKNQALMGESPKEILMRVNNQLCENNEAQMFVTVWFAILDLTTGILTASNAGHEYPAIRRSGGQFELYQDKHGFVLAGMEDVKYREYQLQLLPGDTIFVYTDGVPEATDSKEQLYGKERLLDALNREPDAQPEKLLEQVQEDIDRFVGEAMQFDDITMLALTYHGSSDMQKKISVDAVLENWENVSSFLESQLEQMNCSIKEKIQLETAAEEIFVNIASYAYPQETGKVEIQLEKRSDPWRVCISFRDRGIPYNPLERPEPDLTLSAEQREIGGLGIYMVRKSMDRVSYEYKDGCNMLTIEKAIK